MPSPQNVESLADWIHRHWCDNEAGYWEVLFEGTYSPYRWTVALICSPEGDSDPSGKAHIYSQQRLHFNGEALNEVLQKVKEWLEELMKVCGWEEDYG